MKDLLNCHSTDMIQSGNKFIDDNNNISVTVIYVSYISVFVA